MTDHPFIPVNQPLLDGNEKKYLLECIDSGWISSEGPFVADLAKTPEQRAAIEMLTSQMTNKILHYPILQLKDAPEEPQERETLRVIDELISDIKPALRGVGDLVALIGHLHAAMFAGCPA